MNPGYRETIQCPLCKHEHDITLDLDVDEEWEEVDCQACGETFLARRYMTPRYISKQLPPSEENP